MDAFFTQVPPVVFALAVIVTLIGGFVKGAIGFAMPLVMISGMGSFIAPETVVAAIVLPIMVSNGMQILRGGLRESLSAARAHWRYVVIVCLSIFVSAQFLTAIPSAAMFAILGVTVLVLSAIQLAGLRFSIPPRRRGPVEILVALAAGFLGGISGTWGPPTVLYLIALDMPKVRSIVVQGVVYGTGSVMLLLGHLQSGVLNAATLPLSAALVVPAVAGMGVGFAIGTRLDQERFRKVTLIVLCIAGANLIRRGLTV